MIPNQLIIDKMQDENEQWVDIDNMNGYYQISNHGRVKSFISTRQIKLEEGKILKPFIITKGYQAITLFKKDYRIHRLVAEHFLEKKENKSQVNHIDGNKFNNRVDNLEWVDNRENVIHFYQSKNPGIQKTKNNTYSAKIFFDKKQIYLGTFKTLNEAVENRKKFIEKNKI